MKIKSISATRIVALGPLHLPETFRFDMELSEEADYPGDGAVFFAYESLLHDSGLALKRYAENHVCVICDREKERKAKGKT